MPDDDSKKTKKHAQYTEGVGRRKTAVARVRVGKGKGEVRVNDRAVDRYFPEVRLRDTALAPLRALNLEGKFEIGVHVRGGGPTAQAEAVRHGLARALVASDPEYKRRMRLEGFLTRDSRMVERKKYGLKKARRAPQWQKR